MAKLVLSKTVHSDRFFLGRDFAVRNAVQAMYFCFGAKPANSKFATKTVKKMWILLFFTAKSAEKAKKIEILTTFQRWMKKTNILWASFIILNIWKLLMRKLKEAGGHRRFYQPTEKCKHKQEDSYWYQHSSPLHGSYWYEKWENWKLTCVRAWPPFVKIFSERTQEKQRRVRTSNSFQFSAQYTAILKWEEILKDNEFEKSRKVLAAKRKSLVQEHDNGNKLQAAQAIDELEEDVLFEAEEFGDSNPVALQRTLW